MPAGEEDRRTRRDGSRREAPATEVPAGEVEVGPSRQLATLRTACGWEQKTLASAAGVTAATISKWERGRQKIRESNWRKLSTLLLGPRGREVTVEYLESLRYLRELAALDERDGEIDRLVELLLAEVKRVARSLVTLATLFARIVRALSKRR